LADKEVWVFSEKPGTAARVDWRSAAAHLKPGGGITAVVPGDRAEADRVLSYGAERVLWLGPLKEGYLSDDYVPTLLASG
jgi:hypothetical protein